MIIRSRSRASGTGFSMRKQHLKYHFVIAKCTFLRQIFPRAPLDSPAEGDYSRFALVPRYARKTLKKLSLRCSRQRLGLSNACNVA